MSARQSHPIDRAIGCQLRVVSTDEDSRRAAACEMESDLARIRDLAEAIELIVRPLDVGRPIETICWIIKEKFVILEQLRCRAAGQE
jgi:hypothetical protein